MKSDKTLSPFEYYVSTQSMQKLSSICDFSKGFYYPLAPSIHLNFKFSELTNEATSLFITNNQRKSSINIPDKYNTYIHEIAHAYQFLGSSLGSVYNLCSNFQIISFDEFLSKNQESYGLNYNMLQESRPLSRIVDKYITKWFCYQNFRTIFEGDYTSGNYTPALKDYSQTIKTIADDFFNLYNIHNPKRNNKIKISKLLFQLLDSSDMYFDLFFDHIELFSAYGKEYGSSYPLGPGGLGLFISTKSIIEGYARLCEILFSHKIILPHWQDNENSVFPKRSEYSSSIENKLIGEYGHSFVLLYNYLKSSKDNIILFISIVVHELSLMTRLHPALLFEGEDPNLEEILIPMRFNRLLDLFGRKKASFEDFGGFSVSPIEFMDRICKELGWLSYTSSLKRLIEFNSTSGLSDTYFGKLSSLILEMKITGKLSIFDILENGCPPIPIFLENESTFIQNEKYANFLASINPNEILDITITNFLKDIFSKELIWGSDCSQTKALIKKYVMTEKTTKNDIEQVLQKLRFSDFIKSNELIN